MSQPIKVVIAYFMFVDVAVVVVVAAVVYDAAATAASAAVVATASAATAAYYIAILVVHYFAYVYDTAIFVIVEYAVAVFNFKTLLRKCGSNCLHIILRFSTIFFSRSNRVIFAHLLVFLCEGSFDGCNVIL